MKVCCANGVVIALLIAGVGLLRGIGAAEADHRLADAMERGDRAAVRSLLVQHVDVNARQGDGATALHWAAHWDDLELVTLLIRGGAEVNAANDHGVTPLSLACTNRNLAVAERLLEAGATAGAATSTGETVLMTAARSGSLQIVELLVGRGADVNAREKTAAQTALMWAAAQGHADVVHVLLEHGADVHARSTGGFTALLFAARQGDVESARLLMAAGADVNGQAPDGSSPLLVATASAHEPVAQLLLASGADPNLADSIGYTPLHALVWKPTAKQGLSLPDGSTDLVKALVAHGANPDARITRDPPAVPGSYFFQTGLVGATPFWLAARSGNAAIMRALAASRADPKIRNKGDTTALMVAAGLGQGQGPGSVPEPKLLEAVRAAVDLGADLDATNENGQTAMHGAAGQGFDTIVQFLAERGADVNIADKRGQTPLNAAMRRSSSPTSTVDLLKKFGAHPGAEGNADRRARDNPGTVAAVGNAARSLAIDNVHVRVADPLQSAAWYVKYLDATPAPDPGQVLFGRTLVAFVKTEAAQPSAGSVIDHIGLSYPDLDAKIRELSAAGAKVTVPPADIPGLFRVAFVEDPWRVQIEVIQDPQLLGFHHVHLRVPQPEATLSWFEEMLGGSREKLKGQIDGLRYKTVWLLAASSGTAAPAPSADRAIQNIAWQIPNMTDAVAAFKERRVKTVIEPRALRDLWYAFFEDPNGIRIELIQRPPGY